MRQRFSVQRWVAKAAAVAVFITATMVITGSANAAPGCGLIGYAYDSAGRLVGVSDDTGHVASYSYDATGNTTAVTNNGTPDLWVQSFSPASGAIGTDVSITGGCFSPITSDNNVWFGDVAAQVTYASIHRLVAKVPVGASSAAITVSRASASATSTASFAVTGGATAGPAVTDVGPNVVVPGDTITISGSGFEPATLNNITAVNQTRSLVQSATPSALTAQVPGGVSSGKVSVATPYGEATSPADLFVVPSPYTVADVAYTGRVTAGTSTGVAIPTAGKVALLLFDLADDAYASVSITGGTFGSCGLGAYVKDPRGLTKSSDSCAGTSAYLDRFGGKAGTWTLLLAASSSATGSTAVTINSVPADTTVTATVDGPHATVTTTVPGQNAVVSFTGTAGQRVSTRFFSGTMSVYATIRKPDGTVLKASTYVGNSDFFEPLLLPASGTYTIYIDPSGSAVGSINVQLWDVPADAEFTATVDGPNQTVTTTKPGQNAVLSFTGIAGQRISTRFSAGSISVYAAIRKPDGTVLKASTYVGSSDFWEPVLLPADGTYTIYIDPTSYNVGSITVQLWNVPADTSASAALDGTSVVATTTVPGQNTVVTFTGTAGQRVSTRFSAGTMSVYGTIRNPDGTVLKASSYVGNADFWEPLLLPADGTYTIYIDPTSYAVGSITVQLWNVPADGVTPAILDGAQVNAANSIPGQNVAVTFAGTAGQRASVKFSNGTVTMYAGIRNPDGTVLLATSYVGTSDFFEPVLLPADGTYTVYVDPSSYGVGSINVQMYLVPADSSTAVTINGAAASVTTTRPGQNAHFTFSANDGQVVTVALTNSTLGSTTYTLRKPDGTTLATSSGSGNVTFSNVTMPGAGVYSVYVNPSGATIGSVTAQLYDVPPDATGTVVIGGSTSTITTTTPGQNGSWTFTGTTGQRVYFEFTGGTFGSSSRAYVRVLKPDGTQLLGSISCGTSCNYDTTILPADGTYAITLDPTDTYTGSLTVRLYEVAADVATTVAIGGPAAGLTTTTPGQNGSWTFTGTTGQRVYFDFTGGTFGSSSRAYVRVLKPDGTQLLGSISCGTSCNYDTTVLPADGTYTITLDPQSAYIGTLNARLYDVPGNVSGTVAISGTASALTVPSIGQNGSWTFTGTTGQRVYFDFTGGTFGSSSRAYVRVLKPDGTQLLGSISCGTSCNYDTTVLPADGTYTITLDPQTTYTGTLNARLYEVPADVTTTVAIGGSASTLTVPSIGQNGSWTFTGTTGQRVYFEFTGGTFGSSSRAYTRVLKPDGTQLLGTTSCGVSCYYDTTVLPADGTYTITLDPQTTYTGALTARLYDVPANVSGTVAIGGSTSTLTVPSLGQNGSWTFTGTTGQRVYFDFTGGTFGSSSRAYVRVLKPDGTQLLGTTSCGVSCYYDTTVLPADGTYTITLDPQTTYTGALTARLYDVPADPYVGLTINGGAQSVSTTTPGQNASFGFTGAASQVVTVSLTGNTFGSTSFAVRKPDGTNLSTSSGSGNVTFTNLTLPVAGLYTVYVNPNYAAVGSVSAAVTSTTLAAQTTQRTTTAGTAKGPNKTIGYHNKQLVDPARRDVLVEVPQTDQRGSRGPQVSTFDDTERWEPDRFNQNGQDWESHRAPVDEPRLQPILQGAPGTTALAGRVLVINGRPLPNVTLVIGDRAAKTDAWGRFLLTGLTAGRHEMVILGNTASTPGRSFGIFKVAVDVADRVTTELPYIIWMTRLDTAHAVSIPSPTSRPMSITTPKIPGFEVRLPAGTVIKDVYGDVVKSLSITAIPLDKPPFPLPAGVHTPVYFTVQPGGSYILPKGAQVIYPNSDHLAPGSRVEFWNYDAEDKGWYVYGHGSVTRDGKQIMPDPGVKVYEFTGSMINSGQNGAEDGPGEDGDEDGDPVDLGTGLFVESHTDLMVPDVMPIALTRTYRQRDDDVRAFGIGTNFSYGIFMQSARQWEEADFVFPDSAKVHFVRISPGTGFTDAVFKAVDTTGPFTDATMAWNGNGWDLVRTDGMVFVFGNVAPLQSIRDRHGNQVTLTRAGGGQSGNITQITSPTGRWIKLSYDSSNRVSQAQDSGGRTVGYAYDGSGRLSRVLDVAGNATEYGYDSAHRMTSIKDARGITYLTNTYDAAGRVATQTLADSGVYQFGYATDANGKITQTSVTNPLNHVNVTSFDANQRVVSKTVASGTPAARTMVTERDPVLHKPVRMTDPYGRQTTLAYDSAGNPTSLTVMAGTSSAVSVQSQPGAPYGQVQSVTDYSGRTTTYGYDSRGDTTSVTNAQGLTSTITYNAAGQPTSVTDIAGRTTTYTYRFGDLTTITDPSGRTTKYAVDALGRRIAITDPLGAISRTTYDLVGNRLATVNPLGHPTTFGYDANGNLTTITDPRGHVTTLVYNNSDRVVSATDPLGKAATLGYDLLGRIVSATDRRNKTTVSEYDALGRTTFIGYGKTAGPNYESTLTYNYDTLDRLSSVVDSVSGTTALGYDSLDQITSVTTPQGVLGYSYDQLGRQTGLTVPGQDPISYSYDAAGRLTGVTQGATTAAWTRDTLGRVTGLTQPNLQTAYSYADNGQLSTIGYKNAAGDPIGELTYAYDPNGRVAGKLGSLARVGIPATGPAATYDDADRLTSLGGQAFTYDDEGNLLGDGARTYTWDARNQLTGIAGPGLTASYLYDAARRRVGTTVNGTSTAYLYDGANAVQEKVGGTATVNNLMAGVDQTLQRTDASGVTSPVTDTLGSVLGLADSSGNLTTQYTYDPYGNVTASGAASANTQQFTGRDYDSATGLLYNRLRYYNPSIGRFISQDPAGFGGGSSNMYLYALNDPVNLSDPNGDCPICIAAGIGFLIGGGMGVGFGYLEHKLQGRKYTWGDGIKDFLIWGTIGALTEGLGAWARGAKLAESVWAMNWSARGFEIEARLGGNLPAAFRTIDKFNHATGLATSIKSLDTAAKTYQNLKSLERVVRGYIDSVAAFNGAARGGVNITQNMITGRALELAIPPGASAAQMQVLQRLVQYGNTVGVRVIIHVIP